MQIEKKSAVYSLYNLFSKGKKSYDLDKNSEFWPISAKVTSLWQIARSYLIF